MDNKSDDQLLLIQYTMESNRQDYDDKIKKLTEELTSIITSMMYQIKISKYSLDKRDSPKDKDPTTLVTTSNRVPSL